MLKLVKYIQTKKTIDRRYKNIYKGNVCMNQSNQSTYTDRYIQMLMIDT